MEQGQHMAKLSPCDVKALQKCLQENKGDHAKCEKEVMAFQQACSKPAEPGTAKPQAPAA